MNFYVYFSGYIYYSSKLIVLPNLAYNTFFNAVICSLTPSMSVCIVLQAASASSCTVRIRVWMDGRVDGWMDV